jgi:hypothetical protein
MVSQNGALDEASYRRNSERTKDDGPQEREGGDDRQNVEFQRQTHRATSGCLRPANANPAPLFRQTNSSLRRKTTLNV